MWETLQTTFESIKKNIASPLSNMININMGRAAGIGGFILSLPIFMRAKMITPLQIYSASLSPTAAFFLLNINDYIRSRYLNQHTSALKTDKAIIDEAIKNLQHFYVETEVNAKHSESSKEILEILKTAKMEIIAQPTDSNKLATAIDHCLQNHAQKENAMKYSTHFIDLTASTLTGLSAVFINFIIPIVLKKEFENDAINYPAIALACLFAFYSSCVALANSENSWLTLKKQKAETIESINFYCSLYNDLSKKNDSVSSNEVSQIIMKWQNKHNTLSNV